MSRILVISSSLRAGSNSEALAYAAAKGALDAGNEVETIVTRNIFDPDRTHKKDIRTR